MGCSTLEKQPLTSSSIIYRSDDYLFYRLQEKDNLSNLAQRFLGDTSKAWIIEEKNPEALFEPGKTIIIPLKYENKGGIKENGYQVVPILCYHQFGDRCHSKFCIQTDKFDQQMAFLKKNHFTTITSKMLLDFLYYRQPLPPRSIMISIDDGYRSGYDIAYPILKKYQLTATFFVYTNYVGISDKAITWDQLKEMKENGFEIGSHTISHSDLTQKFKNETDQAHIERIEKELAGSKKIIDNQLKQNTVCLAYPYGRYNNTIKRIARQSGYQMAMTVKPGGNPFFHDTMMLHRYQILSDDFKTFESKLYIFEKF